MMTGLMMVFLFISIAFMQQIGAEKQAVKDIALTYTSYQEDLHESLVNEFEHDLSRWNAEILKDTTIRFNEPDVLFDEGSKEIKPRFQTVLNEFFPRYIKLLAGDKFRSNIEEVRIEGHTSSTWKESKDIEERYLNNALLSQQRSFTILNYCFRVPQIIDYQPWLTKVLRANGLAFANPILIDGNEEPSRSRRVEFKVKSKADEKIREIINTFQQSGQQS